MESRSYNFPFRMVFFYLITTSWIYCISLLGDNSINNSINIISRFFSLYLVEEVFFLIEIFPLLTASGTFCITHLTCRPGGSVGNLETF